MVFFIAAPAIVAHAQESPQKPLAAVPDVDLNRYMGTWYEIARFPNSFQTNCAGDVTATYSLLEDGDVQVVNRCRKENGEMTETKGRAKLADENGPKSKLKVRFAPAILSWLPFVWGDYWIIVLPSDYSYVVVGEPKREYLWILSRTPAIDPPLYQQILAQIQEKGYDVTKLVQTRQSH